MFPGEIVKITFEFSGLSLQSVLDRLPNARVIDKKGNKSIVTAEVNYGRGLIMYLLSQGSWIKVLSPASLINDINHNSPDTPARCHDTRLSYTAVQA